MINSLIDDLKPYCNTQSIILNLKRALTTFTLKGRSNRAEFLTFFLAHQAILIFIIFLFQSTGLHTLFSELSTVNIHSINNPTIPNITDSMIYTLMFCLVSFLIIEIMLFLLIARRLHDSGRSAWWYLLIYASSVVNYIIPIAQILTTLYLGLLPSENQDNKYGIIIEK